MPSNGYITRSTMGDLNAGGYVRVGDHSLANENGMYTEDVNVLDNDTANSVAVEEMQAYQNMHEQSILLQQSKRRGRNNREIEDSALMKKVKNSMSQLTGFLFEKEIPAEEETFQAQLSDLEEKYQELINNCDEYLNERNGILKFFKIGQGYERLHMVKDIRNKAKVESTRIRVRSRRVFEKCKNINEEEEERPLWINALAEARTEHLDLSKHPDDAVEYVGGNCNNVIRLEKNGKVAFIKEDEFNYSAKDKIVQNKYLSEAPKLDEYKDVKDKIGKLRHPYKFRQILKGEDRQEYLARVYQAKEYYETQRDNDLQGLLKILSRECVNGMLDRIIRDKKTNAEKFDTTDGQKEILRLLTSKKKIKTELNGFFTDEELQSEPILKLIGHYSKYHFRHSISHNMAEDTAQIDEGSCLTSRNVATFRLAELLGLTDLIPEARKVEYKEKNGTRRKGVIMSEAKGSDFYDVHAAVKKKQIARPTCDAGFLLQMNSLQIMDVIAGQVDRHGRNMMMDLGGGQQSRFVKGIKGIDNDLSFGKIPYSVTQSSYSKTVISVDGYCTLAYIDVRLANRIRSLNDAMLDYAFGDLLTKDELSALKERLTGVRELLDTMDPHQFIEPRQLTVKHVQGLLDQKKSYSNMLKCCDFKCGNSVFKYNPQPANHA